MTLIFNFPLTFLTTFLAMDQSPCHSIRSKDQKFKVFKGYFETDILNDLLLFFMLNSFIQETAFSLLPFSIAKLLELANNIHTPIHLTIFPQKYKILDYAKAYKPVPTHETRD